MLVIEALNNGKTIKSNSTHPRYYKKHNGKLYFSNSNNDYQQWKISNANENIFKIIENWIILN